jgi:uncharacterized membrane protein YcaP (DUF421 family)
VLVLLQFVVAWSAVRFRWVDRLVKSEPTLLVHDGRLLHDALRRERVTEGEVRSAVRSGGVGDLSQAAAVVLETDGTFTVLRHADGEGVASVLRGVRRTEDGAADAPKRTN